MIALEGVDVKRAVMETGAIGRTSAAASIPSSATLRNPLLAGVALDPTNEGPGRTAWRGRSATGAKEVIVMRTALVAFTIVAVGITLAAYAAGLTVLQIGQALS